MDGDRELREAIAAADDAMDSLERADSRLRSARNWGVWDMLGDAGAEMENARQALLRFRRELEDVDRIIDPGFANFDLTAFGDLFLDGFLFDLLAQGRIADARRQVEEAMNEVRRIRARLEARLRG